MPQFSLIQDDSYYTGRSFLSSLVVFLRLGRVIFFSLDLTFLFGGFGTTVGVGGFWLFTISKDEAGSDITIREPSFAPSSANVLPDSSRNRYPVHLC